MRGWQTAARRLTAAGAVALALTATGVTLAPAPLPADPVAPDLALAAGGSARAARDLGALEPGNRVLGPPVGESSRPGQGLPVVVHRGAGVALPEGRGDPAPGPGGLLGVVGYKPAVLVRLDPWTLRPLPGPRIRLRYGVSAYGWSPDRSLLVLGDIDDDALHLVDPVRPRLLATLKFGIVAEAPQWLAWLGPRRLAVVAGSSSDGSTLLLVDPFVRRIISRRALPPGNFSVAAAGDRLVLLRSSFERIGPVELLVVDDRGGIRTVAVPWIHAGIQHPPDWGRPGAYAVSRDGGLAVDPEGGRAFVVAAGAPVAEVDLASGRVTERRLRQPASLLRRLARWLVPRAEAKAVVGDWRGACWLGGGWLAVWGSGTTVAGPEPTRPIEHRHSGLKLIDTRDWTVRTLDPAATMVRWQAGRLLTFGGAWDYEAMRQRGVGVTIHGPGDRAPRHLLGARAVVDAHLNGDLLYASVDTGREEYGRVVASVREGRVLASSAAPLPYLLLGVNDRPC